MQTIREKTGATIDVCAIYLPGRNADPLVLLDGIGVAKPGEMAEKLMAPDARVLSFQNPDCRADQFGAASFDNAARACFMHAAIFPKSTTFGELLRQPSATCRGQASCTSPRCSL
ncbi:hypothetical protein SAMN05443432_11615 [Roseovarius litoreus]|uniref:Uncharacterized protein n=1 Tax=Roseovarius litoreus TaxID=1155722 RepID=A0A1M7LGL3_9RHOB|nr:hypothetical protein SAMN05443432_11615 [Roseovarius litoreus]